MPKSSFLASSLLVLAAGVLTLPASAQLTTTLTAQSQGWYNSFGDTNQPSETNFLAGSYEGIGYRNFFAFNRSVPELNFVEIRKATLEIFLPEILFAAGDTYFSTDPNDTGALFSLYKYEGNLMALRDGSGGLAAFDDLGEDAGGSFGSRMVSSADNVPGTLVAIDLSAYFLEYLNGLSGEFVLGGALSDPNDAPSPDDYEFMFALSENAPMAALRLEFVAVPEPSTYGLLGAGALGLLIWRRRAMKAKRLS